MMQYFPVRPDGANAIGNSTAIYHGPGPADAVKVTVSMGGIQNPWINKVWTEYLESIPAGTVPENANLGFSIGNVTEMEPDKVYHVEVQFFTA